jgi:ADP-ribose pyrophosphatase YjhB (NUDIX family)
LSKVKKIPKEIFDYIENYIPFSSVDIIIYYKDEGIILTKRAIRPYRGWWHLPGSVILKNEKIIDAVRRSAREELGVRLTEIQFLGNYELFTKQRHYITHTFVAQYESGKIKPDEQSSDISIVLPRKMPKNTIPVQRLMVQDALNKRILCDV